MRPSYNTLLSMHRKDQDRLLELTQEIPRLRSSHAEELSTLQKLIESMTKSAAADATAKQVLEQEAASAKNLAQEHTELRSQLRQLQQQLSSEKSQRMKLQVESATRSNNNKARVDELEKQLAECQTAKAAVEADLTKERKRAENEKGKGSRLKPPSRTIDLSIDDDIQVVEPSSSSSGRGTLLHYPIKCQSLNTNSSPELSFRPNNTSNNIGMHSYSSGKLPLRLNQPHINRPLHQVQLHYLTQVRITLRDVRSENIPRLRSPMCVESPTFEPDSNLVSAGDSWKEAITLNDNIFDDIASCQ